MKLHYRNTHPEVFPTLQHNVNRDVERSATACVRCHYCGESQRDWKAHPLKCTTIWQCAVLCVLQDPDHVRWYQHGPGDGRVLRGGEEQRCTGDGANGAGQRQAAPRKPAIFEALGARPSQPLGRLRADQVARKLPFPQRRAPLVYSLAQASDSTGGGDQASTAGHLDGSLAELRRGLDIASSLHNGSRVQKEATKRAHMGLTCLSSKSWHSPCSGSCATATRRSSTVHSFRTEPRRWVGTTLQVGGEPETEGTGARQIQEPGAGARDVQQAGTLCGAHQTGCGTSLSLHATHLTETMEGKKTFKLHLSVRNKHAEEVWDLLGELQGCCVFQLIGLGYRRERLGRGPMAQKTQEMTRY